MYGGVYRCIGDTAMRNVLGAYRCMGGCTGGVQMYGDIQMYRGPTDVWGCTYVWESVQMYGGMYR